jgi:hypothetical protein
MLNNFLLTLVGFNIFTAGVPVLTISVPDFPDNLLIKNGSNHASTVFNFDPDQEIRNWFRNVLVCPIPWVFPHPDELPPDKSVQFESYIQNFLDINYQVRNINHPVANSNTYIANSNTYIAIKREVDNKTVYLSGRADYVVCLSDANDVDYMYKAVCVIEIQSKPNIELCELQMLVYLMLLMNTKSLTKLIGFLVLNDGRCRTYKATRQNGNVVYEEDDLFHVSFIADVFQQVWNSA